MPAGLRRSLELIALLAMGGAGDLAAQGELRLPRVREAIRLDGRIVESAWLAAPPIPLTMFVPTAGAAPTDSSEVRLAYDDRYLYAAGRFLVRDPAEIQVSSLGRDRLGADDVFRVLLDTFDDNENAVVFATTPAGVQADFAVARDGEDVSDGWNSFWDVATTRDSLGWTAEIRIPLSSLRFQAIGGRVTMGLIVSRFSARKNELSTFPALAPRLANAQYRPSAAATVLLEGLASRSPVYATPYGLVGGTWTPEPVVGGSGPRIAATLEAGLDVKTPLTSNLALDLTVNTDFAQVEADDEQVNLTRFSLFFPEKRQFFLERAGIFAFPTGRLMDPSLLFHSRRIGLDPSGRPLRVYGGARLVGRTGDWDLGALSLQTRGVDSTGGPAGTENVGVLRVRRRVFNSESTAGLLVTSRVGLAGRANIAVGTDARVRVMGRDYATVQLGLVAADGARAGVDAGMMRVAWERPSTLTSQGLAYQAGVKWSGPAFDPALGFQPRRDFTHGYVNARYGWFPPRGPLRVFQPSLVLSGFLRNADQAVESGFAAMFFNYEMKSGVNGWIGLSRISEDLQQPLGLSPAVAAPAGRHTWTEGEFTLMPPIGRAFRVGLSAGAGGFYDGTQVSVSAEIAWSPSAHVEIQGRYERRALRFAGRSERLDPDLARLRFDYTLDAHLSLSALLQYNRLVDQAGGNARLRYRFAEGRDLYAVWNERADLSSESLDGLGLRSLGRTVLVKYSHTLIW